MGRHQGARHPDAALVAVDPLRHHRLGGDLQHPLPGLADGHRRHPGPARLLEPRQTSRPRSTPRAAANAALDARLAAADLGGVEQDPELLHFATAGGAAVFRNNCAPCHGAGAAGVVGRYPNLLDDDWLWGGTADGHPADRHPRHPLRGRPRHPLQPDAGLRRDPRARGDRRPRRSTCCRSPARPHDPAAAEAAQQLFIDNCASCHGEDGTGGREFGAPNLTDGIWLYGGDPATIHASIENARFGDHAGLRRPARARGHRQGRGLRPHASAAANSRKPPAPARRQACRLRARGSRRSRRPGSGRCRAAGGRRASRAAPATAARRLAPPRACISRTRRRRSGRSRVQGFGVRSHCRSSFRCRPAAGVSAANRCVIAWRDRAIPAPASARSATPARPLAGVHARRDHESSRRICSSWLRLLRSWFADIYSSRRGREATQEKIGTVR